MMDQLQHFVWLLHSHAESLGTTMRNFKVRRSGTLCDQVLPFIFCSILSSFFAYVSCDALLAGVVTLTVGLSYLKKKKQRCKTCLVRPFECKQTSEAPKILAPTFRSSNPHEQIQELITKIKPKPEHLQVVTSLTESINHVINRELLLDAAVVGYTYANPLGDAPLVKIEPQISVVVNIDLVKYHMRHQDDQKLDNKRGSTLKSAPKNIIRRIKKCLVSKYGFKLRRFTFTDSVRVMLSANVPHGSSHERACMQISVNNALPIRGAKLMAFCNQFQPVASCIVLLVQHWTRWRALCLVDNGDLNPYGWAILAIFYMQVYDETHSHLLPPFNENAKVSTKESGWGKMHEDPIELLKGFFRFYGQSFDFTTEVVSVSRAKRSQRTHPSHASLCIEDPFDAQANVASTVTQPRAKILRQEFQRADHLLSSGASLTDLLVFPQNIYA